MPKGFISKYYDFDRNILGRQGWHDRVRLGLIDYDGKLYISDYNDPASLENSSNL